MEIELVQAQIGYQFSRPDRLRLALRAAHRSDIDGTSDDGNRGLAKLGMCAVEMTETYRSIIIEKRTSSRLRFLSIYSLMAKPNRGRQHSRSLVQK